MEDVQEEEDSLDPKNGKMLFSQGMPKRNLKDFLFANLRYEYLDKMPPFQIEITSKLYEVCLANGPQKKIAARNEEADFILQKLQALFCSRVLPDEAITEANAFLELNKTITGYASLKSILMTHTDAVTYLSNTCPQCLLQYGQDCFTISDEWELLIMVVQNHIMRLAADLNLNRVCFFYKKVLKAILTHLATTMHVEQFEQVLPQCNTYCGDGNTEKSIIDEIYCYDPYITTCKETMRANQIKKLITTTGQQLLCTLNL